MTSVFLGLLLWLQAALLLPSADAVEYACTVPSLVVAQLAPSSPRGRCRSECGDTTKRCASLQIVSGASRTEMGPVRPASSSLYARARPLRRLGCRASGCGSPAAGAAGSGAAEHPAGGAAAAPERGGFATIC